MFWRLPIIRHIRWLILCRRIEQHYELWRSLGYLPVHRHFDDEVLDAIWRGER